MATALRWAKGQPFFDNNGALLASGTLTFYRAGTTTLLNVYSDAAGATALPNPITLNASGRAVDGSSVAVAIYLKDLGFDYKEVIANSSGTVLYTDDNIAEPVDPGASLSDFAKPTTAWSTDTAASVNLAVGDAGTGRLASTGSNSITYNLPSAAAFVNGRPITIKKVSASNTVTLDADGTDTIDGAATFAWTENQRAYKLSSDGANWRIEEAYLANLNADDITPTMPTVQRLTSGSGTYTPTAGTKYIRVRMVAGGGGGGAVATNNGGFGTDSGFGGWFAGLGGAGGAASGAGGGEEGAGGTGGANGTGTLIVRVDGQNGDDGGAFGATAPARGGSSFFGGGGASGGHGASGGSAKANTGSGGAGGTGTGGSSDAGAGGGAGEYVEFFMTAAQIGASVSYTVGAGGAGGAAGTQAGGNGAAGIIIIEEYY